ncbi:MAG: DUF1553 domain-containing protein [Planctomycetales bacterium]|nr:DUF1553 domain-containing protein [Planctomycetales bacterium]
MRRYSFSARLVEFSLTPLLLAACLNWAVAQDVDFARDVQPIFAKHCVACHGPGEAEGGLQITDQASVFGELDSGEVAVVGGKPDESELLARITSDDEDTRMPPEGKPLSAKQIDVIQRWIAQGATWKEHWGFVPPKPISPPELSADGKSWARHGIDAFIWDTLRKNDLKPAAPAPPEQLMRRAYYDLTGLPPTPEEVHAYLADSDVEGRYARLVDRLLDSDHFGERWARHWLDLVRFAETNSYERDGDKPHAWRYRNYVIRSFNQDKPYDQFIIEQLAGDEIENPTPDSIIATGYYRLGLWDDEPADPALARYDGLDDIVTTTGQVFLGLTINCARCHDHKIDPIQQTDYYGMLAFFHNITHMNRAGDRIERPIYLSMTKDEFEKRTADLKEKRDSMQLIIQDLEKQFATEFQKSRGDAAGVKDITDLRYKFYRSTWEELPNFDDIKFEEDGDLPKGRFDISLASRNHSFGFVFEGNLIVPEDGEYTFHVDSDDGSRLVIDGNEILKYDGIHGIGNEKNAKAQLKKGTTPIRLDYFQAHGGLGLSVAWSGPSVERRSLTANEASAEQITDMNRALREHGRDVMGDDWWKQFQDARKERDRLNREQVPVERALSVTEHGRNAPETFVLTRGSPHTPAEKVEPQFPAIFGVETPELPDMPADAASTGRRLVLAKWIASADNMQTSRVMANRIWQHLFGRGIVESTSNFGIIGTPPTHPDLLNWLGHQFVESGWSIKSTIRMIMLSSAYQMSSTADEQALAKDPTNRLFWRQNMRRLSAEEIRDSILSVNGTLNTKMYGRSVYPTIPAEVLAGQSRPGAGWGNSSPEDQARRSIYIYVKRSLKVPIIESFDFAETDLSCPVRFSTTQPTQALGMLNSEFSNDQAKELAKRLRSEAGKNVRDQVARGLWLTTQREPADDDVQRALKLIDELQTKDNVSADRALELFCLMVLNLNEFIYVD